MRRPGAERPDGPLAWLYAHLVLLTVGAALGAGVGYIFPLIVYTQTSRRPTRLSERRPRDLGEAVVRAGRGLTEQTEGQVHDAALAELKDGTDADARRRAAIGALLGALVACGIAVASSRRAPAAP